MTFQEWQATRKWLDDLSSATGMDHDTYPSGFIYRHGAEHIESREWGFGVVIANTETEFNTLEDAEAHLWAEWANGEINEGIAL